MLVLNDEEITSLILNPNLGGGRNFTTPVGFP